jgi:hypothetical protein
VRRTSAIVRHSVIEDPAVVVLAGMAVLDREPRGRGSSERSSVLPGDRVASSATPTPSLDSAAYFHVAATRAAVRATISTAVAT